MQSVGLTETLHITTNLLFMHRDQAVLGTALLPGLDLLEVGIREGFSPGELLLCAGHSPGNNSPCSGAWGMLLLCLLMCAQETDLPFSSLAELSAPLAQFETWGGVPAWG